MIRVILGILLVFGMGVANITAISRPYHPRAPRPKQPPRPRMPKIADADQLTAQKSIGHA